MDVHGVNESVFVAVDSGGSRTNVELRVGQEDGDLLPLSTYEVSATLSGALAAEEIPRVLRQILAPAESALDDVRDLPVYVWISAAGYSPLTREDFLDALEEAKGTVLGPQVRCVGTANDAVTVLLGSGADAIVIAGTGSAVLLRSKDGTIHRAGGQEWVATDAGSGFWIGLLGIRGAYRDFENGRDSVLLQRFVEQYGLARVEGRRIKAKVRELAVGDHDMKKEIARFAAAVCAAAERGDESSQDIVKSEAEDLADVTAGSLRRVFNRIELSEHVKVVQVGALLGNAFYRGSFETQLLMRLLSGSDLPAVIDFEQLATVINPALAIAQSLASEPDRHLGVDRDFRPIVLRWD